MANPYSELDKTAFWRAAVAEQNPFNPIGIYRKKWDIQPDWKIAAAGSCFAQHISRYLKRNGFNVIDAEPPPTGLPANQHLRFGYSMYSARYGNIYTTRQLLQLAQEATGTFQPSDHVWTRDDGRYIDAFRPAVEPDGLDSHEEAQTHRDFHLARVLELFQTMDLFIFTLGLTETWQDKLTGTVYPTAPGTIAGDFDPERYQFVNFSFNEVLSDFRAFMALMNELRGSSRPLRYLLTVSPVPLTATASGQHVLQASTYSKSVLRAVAGELVTAEPDIDYFPSFEIITNQVARGVFFEPNMRSIRDDGVESVMRVFFSEHGQQSPEPTAATVDDTNQAASRIRSEEEDTDVQCEEALAEVFMK